MDCNPWDFPRQEYWSGLPFSFPEDLSQPGFEHTSSALAGRLFTTESPGKPGCYVEHGAQGARSATGRPSQWSRQEKTVAWTRVMAMGWKAVGRFERPCCYCGCRVGC